MWAGTVALRVGTWLVGVRVDTPKALEAVRRHFADRVVPDGVVDSNYTVIAPHIVMGHGTLYRAGQEMTTSRRLSRLFDALQDDFDSLVLPDGWLRVLAVVHHDGTHATLESPWRATDDQFPFDTVDVVWIDPSQMRVRRPSTGDEWALAAVVLRSPDRHADVLTGMHLPATAATRTQWVEVLANLSRDGRLHVSADADAAQLALHPHHAGE